MQRAVTSACLAASLLFGAAVVKAEAAPAATPSSAAAPAAKKRAKEDLMFVPDRPAPAMPSESRRYHAMNSSLGPITMTVSGAAIVGLLYMSIRSSQRQHRLGVFLEQLNGVVNEHAMVKSTFAGTGNTPLYASGRYRLDIGDTLAKGMISVVTPSRIFATVYVDAARDSKAAPWTWNSVRLEVPSAELEEAGLAPPPQGVVEEVAVPAPSGRGDRTAVAADAAPATHKVVRMELV